MVGIKEEFCGDMFAGVSETFEVKVPVVRKQPTVFTGLEAADVIKGKNFNYVEVVSLTDFKKFILPKLDKYVEQKVKELKREFEKIEKAKRELLELQMGNSVLITD